jgi:hypothetical protein
VFRGQIGRRLGLLAALGFIAGMLVGTIGAPSAHRVSATFAATTNAAGFGSAVNLSDSCGNFQSFRTALATNASGAVAGAWVCANNDVEAGVESASGVYSGPFVLGQGDLEIYDVPQVQIAMDAAGDAVVAWESSSYQIFAATMQAGQSFTPAVLLSDDSDVLEGGQVAMDSSGDAIVSWGGSISIMRAGGSFGPPIGGLGNPTSVALNDSGDVVIGGNGEISIMQDWGTFGAPVAFASSSAQGSQVGIDALGDVTAVWVQDVVTTNGGLDLETASMAAGTNQFGSPATIESISGPFPGFGTIPSVVDLLVNGAGDEVVAWQQNQDIFSGTADWLLEVSEGTVLGGLQAPIEVADTGIYHPFIADDLVGLALDPQGDGFLGWEATERVYTPGIKAPTLENSAYTAEVPALSLSRALLPDADSPKHARGDVQLVSTMKAPAQSAFLLASNASGVSVATGRSGRVVAAWGGSSCSFPVVKAAAMGETISGIRAGVQPPPSITPRARLALDLR